MAADASTHKSPASVCGKAWCQCGKIMAHFQRSRTPFFFADKNFTRRRGPNLPYQFVEEHGWEMNDVVMLEAVGNVFAVKLEVIRGSIEGEDTRRLGLGWESFFLASQVEREDLLFFTLEGHSRFAVGCVRGHSRRERVEARADAAPPNGKRKLELDDLDGPDSDLEEVTAQVWYAAKLRKLRRNSKSPARKHPLRERLDSQDIVELSPRSEDVKPPRSPQEACLTTEPLSSSASDTSLSSDSDEPSNFESESDFKRFGADWGDYTSS